MKNLTDILFSLIHGEMEHGKIISSYLFSVTPHPSLPMYIGACILRRDLASWCKNNITSKTFQTNITTFIMLMLVDAFTLHMLRTPSIVFIPLSMLYALFHIWYVYEIIYNLYNNSLTKYVLLCILNVYYSA
jgi:hypothetical protein